MRLRKLAGVSLPKSTNQLRLASPHSRLKREIAARLAAMPEHHRAHAEVIMNRMLLRSYGLSEERLKPLVAVVFDALEGIPGRL